MLLLLQELPLVEDSSALVVGAPGEEAPAGRTSLSQGPRASLVRASTSQLQVLMESETFANAATTKEDAEGEELVGVIATSRMYDVDVFGLTVVELEQNQDMV